VHQIRLLKFGTRKLAKKKKRGPSFSDSQNMGSHSLSPMLIESEEGEKWGVFSGLTVCRRI
jgi:hypothetical protein